MKKLILLIALAVGIGTVSKAQTTTTAVAAVTGEFKFDAETFDFGKVPVGKPAEHIFTFTNTGKAPIIISNVEVTCGCTVSNYTQTPVKPGEKGTIKVTVTKTSPTVFNQSVTIISNARTPKKVLYAKGETVAASNS
jgi:hypothetical protein